MKNVLAWPIDLKWGKRKCPKKREREEAEEKSGLSFADLLSGQPFSNAPVGVGVTHITM